jgi:hypothetical protein
MLDDKEMLKFFDKSVSKALAIKKALGHYAVIWDEEKEEVVRIEADDLPEYQYKNNETFA